MKTAKDQAAAWGLQHRFEDPSAWIQWKGTDACMSIQCHCGFHSHIDSTFAYFVECPKCHQVYFCNGHIELIALEERPEYGCGVVMEDLDERIPTR